MFRYTVFYLTGKYESFALEQQEESKWFVEDTATNGSLRTRIQTGDGQAGYARTVKQAMHRSDFTWHTITMLSHTLLLKQYTSTSQMAKLTFAELPCWIEKEHIRISSVHGAVTCLVGSLVPIIELHHHLGRQEFHQLVEKHREKRWLTKTLWTLERAPLYGFLPYNAVKHWDWFIMESYLSQPPTMMWDLHWLEWPAKAARGTKKAKFKKVTVVLANNELRITEKTCDDFDLDLM